MKTSNKKGTAGVATVLALLLVGTFATSAGATEQTTTDTIVTQATTEKPKTIAEEDPATETPSVTEGAATTPAPVKEEAKPVTTEKPKPVSDPKVTEKPKKLSGPVKALGDVEAASDPERVTFEVPETIYVNGGESAIISVNTYGGLARGYTIISSYPTDGAAYEIYGDYTNYQYVYESFGNQTSDSITFRVCDYYGCLYKTTNIVVDIPNRAPVTPDYNVTIDEDTTVFLTPSATDPDGDAMTYLYDQPQHGNVGGYLNGDWIYIPNHNFNGTDTFTYRAYDGDLFTYGTVNVAVTPVNDVPFAYLGNQSSYDQGTEIALDVEVIDEDNDQGDITISVADATGGTAEVRNGTVYYTSEPNFAGNAVVTINVFDGTDTFTTNLNVRVDKVHYAPVITGETDLYTLQDQTSTHDVEATDANGDDVTLEVITTNEGATATIDDDGNVKYVPAEGHYGEGFFQLVATDTDGDQSDIFTVTVHIFASTENINSTLAPGEAFRNYLADEQDGLTLDPLSDFNTANGQVVFTQIDGDGGAYTVYTYTPNPGFTGVETFTISYCYGNETICQNQVVTVTVIETEDPIISVPPVGPPTILFPTPGDIGEPSVIVAPTTPVVAAPVKNVAPATNETTSNNGTVDALGVTGVESQGLILSSLLLMVIGGLLVRRTRRQNA